MYLLTCEPLSFQLTHANLNQMLCPSPSDPFKGQFYRILAMIHQPLLILFIGKLFTILVFWLQQRDTSLNYYLKPLCSFFNWYPCSAQKPPAQSRLTNNQPTNQHAAERAPTSFKELCQSQLSEKDND